MARIALDWLRASLRRLACELCGSYWHTKYNHCPKHLHHVGLMDCWECIDEIGREHDRRIEAAENRRLDALADKIVERLRGGA